MTKTTTPSFFILNSFLLASICLHLSLTPTSADKTFVIDTCHKTDTSNLCSTILLSDPRSVNATSVTGLAYIALDIAAKSADFASSDAAALAGKYAGLPEGDALNMCKQAFLGASDDLTEAQTELSQQSYMEAEGLATKAVEKADSCEAAFADRGLKSLMSDTDKAVHDQSHVAADIIGLLSGYM